MKIFWKLITIVLVVATLATFSLAVLACVKPVSPEEITFKLPKFQGRIFGPGQVYSRTFSIEREFKDTGSWGKDSILYCRPFGRAVIMEAWRPDPLTVGVFEHAEEWRYFDVPFYHVVKGVKINGSESVTVFVGKDILVIIPLGLIAFVLLFNGALTSTKAGW